MLSIYAHEKKEIGQYHDEHSIEYAKRKNSPKNDVPYATGAGGGRAGGAAGGSGRWRFSSRAAVAASVRASSVRRRFDIASPKTANLQEPQGALPTRNPKCLNVKGHIEC